MERMSIKSRGNYAVTVCLRKCANRGPICDDCIAMKQFKEISLKGVDNNAKSV